MYDVLPGFLGHFSDWSFLKGIQYIDIFCQKNFDPQYGLQVAGKTISNCSKNKILLGYSLGGRLGLHALISDPFAWHAAVIVSAHYGLNCKEEKRARLARDESWAFRFENEPWESLMQGWNEQEIFRGFAMPRKEMDYCRMILAKTLRGWSLGKQKCLKGAIEQLNLPILWITGENDKRFTLLAQNLKFLHPLSRHVVIKDTAHRVIWENPGAFLKELKRFEHDLEGK